MFDSLNGFWGLSTDTSVLTTKGVVDIIFGNIRYRFNYRYQFSMLNMIIDLLGKYVTRMFRI